MNKTKRFIAFLLCTIVLITGIIVIFPIPVNATTTTVDLTGLSSGSETSHDCSKYLTTKYDSSQHWQECTVCGKFYGNKSNHTFSAYWTMGNSCSESNYYVEICSCGFTRRNKSYESQYRTKHSVNNEYSCNLLYHVKLCKNCKDEILDKQYHTDSNGNQLSCTNPGICSVCGTNVSSHYEGARWINPYRRNNDAYSLSITPCMHNCGISIIDRNNSSCNITQPDEDGGFTINSSFYILQTDLFYNIEQMHVDVSKSSYYDRASVDIANFEAKGRCVTLNFKGKFRDGIGEVWDSLSGVVSFKTTDKYGNNAQWHYIDLWTDIKPDITAPTINESIDQKDISSSNGWSTSKQITVSGTENYCNSIKLTMTDDVGINYLNDVSVPVINGSWTYDFIPDIEADANGKKFTITATDTLGNSSQQTFDIYKTDKKIPTMTSETETTQNWSKTKNFTFTATDTGAGNVQIAFNNTNDYALATQSGSSYSRDYTFIGDVYGNVTAAVYFKDAVGNETTKFIKVYNLDNTKPTITDTSISVGKGTANITVTANDINTKLNASGSGVVGYGISTTEKEPTSWQTSNILTVNKNGIYYIYAKDAVGNISSPKKVSVTELTAAYKVLHQQEQLNGTYTTVETENLSGTIGSSVTPAVKSYTGFTSSSTQTVTISADGSTTVTYKYARKTYDLDVNVILDGTSYNTGVDGITFDVYVNGTKVGSGKDFCKRSAYKYGSTYEIKNISCPGYTFDTSSSIKGTITANMNVQPKFTTNSYTVTYKDVVDNTSGSLLGQSTLSKKYGSSVRGTDIGSSTADNAYYNGYYYVSDTSATVGTSGATVYRVFKLRTINITGTVNWIDNSNKWSTRPNQISVYLYRDGTNVDSTKGLTSADSNNYSFNNVPKYSTSDGHVYNYTVSQSEAVSKTSPEDKYTTTQNTYNFTNVLGNTDKDADNKGLTVKGSIYWEDKGDALGYRPNTVTITLYQNGIEYKTLEVDSFNDNTYEFSKLPKYDKDLNKYEYTVKETMVANYLVTENGQPVLKDAYSIKADTPNALDFTNVFNVPGSAPVPVKPEHENTVTVKTNTEDMITISLKGMETIINSDLSVSYGNNYNGQVYNLSANNIGTVLSSINSGKYEISYLDATYVLNDITCNGDNNIWIEGSGDKYFLVIKDTNVDVSGTITLNFSKKDHVGYQTDASVSNYFKVGVETTAIMSLEAEVFAISDMIIEAEDAYSIIYNNSDTIDENIYNEGDEVEVLDYQVELPENKEFLGWALSKDVEKPDYLVGDIINIENKDINLYPVFKDIEEKETSEIESTEETTESSESMEESSETEESTMEEKSSEEETFESEESSTENNFSEKDTSSTEEESPETIDNSILEE